MAASFALVTPSGNPSTVKPHAADFDFICPYVMTGDSSYPTGGYPLVASTLAAISPMMLIRWVDVQGVDPNTASVANAWYDAANGKVMFIATDGTQVANGIDVSSVRVNVKVWGR